MERPLRIGIDIGSALVRDSGIGFYAENLLAGLAETNKTDQFFLYTAFWGEPRRLDALALPRAANFHLVHKRAPQRLLLPLDECGAGIQERWLKGLGLDVFHGLGHILPPLKSIRTVATLHHLGPLPRQATAWERFYLGELPIRSLRRADRVIAVSDYSHRDAVENWDLDPKRLVTVHHGGPSPAFRPGSGPSSPPYILHVGTFLEHKNIPMLVRAFSLWLKNRPGRTESLILVGRPGPDLPRVEALVAESGLGGRVKILPPCPRDELVKLYQNAEMVTVPSTLEGFGFSVLEGMACAAPVLASTGGSLPEVAGDAALMIDPRDADAWALGFEKIASDPALAASLRRRGPERAAGFTWAQAARETLAVYRGLATAR